MVCISQFQQSIELVEIQRIPTIHNLKGFLPIGSRGKQSPPKKRIEKDEMRLPIKRHIPNEPAKKVQEPALDTIKIKLIISIGGVGDKISHQICVF